MNRIKPKTARMRMGLHENKPCLEENNVSIKKGSCQRMYPEPRGTPMRNRPKMIFQVMS
jgi:hypothetical protein